MLKWNVRLLGKEQGDERDYSAALNREIFASSPEEAIAMGLRKWAERDPYYKDLMLIGVEVKLAV